MPTARKPTGTVSTVFSAEERAAMKELAKERKAIRNKAEAEADCLAKIAEMPAADREMAERLRKLIVSAAPQLAPKTWYGMPAYTKDGNVVCFFQSGAKFKARYATLGFTACRAGPPRESRGRGVHYRVEQRAVDSPDERYGDTAMTRRALPPSLAACR